MLHKTRVVICFRDKKPSAQTTRNFALVCLWCGRTIGRSVGVRSRDCKFSQMGSLPHFLTHGAPLRALRARELSYYQNLLSHQLESAVHPFEQLGPLR